MFLNAKKYSAGRAVLRGFVFLFFLSALFGCASNVLKRVAKQESPMLKLIIARDMITQTRYGLALRILEDIKKNYSENTHVVIEVDYEIAFIALSRKRYEEAKTRLEAIVQQYDALENKNVLPQWPYYLSKRLLETSVNPVIEKRTKKREKTDESSEE